MKTYIINLPIDSVRKQHIINLLENNNLINDLNLDITWINPVYGQNLNDHAIQKEFNIKKYNKFHYRKITSNQIGCTLSHRKCYIDLLKSTYNYALILEDDIEQLNNLKTYVKFLENIIDKKVPCIILLSDWIESFTSLKIDEKRYLHKIFQGRSAYAYLINKKAVEIILREKPWYISDEWEHFINNGIDILAIKPSVIIHCDPQKFISRINISIPDYKFSISKYVHIKYEKIRILVKYFSSISNSSKFPQPQFLNLPIKIKMVYLISKLNRIFL